MKNTPFGMKTYHNFFQKKKKTFEKKTFHPKKTQNILQKNTKSLAEKKHTHKTLNEDKHNFFIQKNLKQKHQTSCKKRKNSLHRNTKPLAQNTQFFAGKHKIACKKKKNKKNAKTNKHRTLCKKTQNPLQKKKTQNV